MGRVVVDLPAEGVRFRQVVSEFERSRAEFEGLGEVSFPYLLLGLRTRVAAVAAWLTHASMNVTGFLSIYGVDEFANIALFYMIWMPVGDEISLDRRTGRSTNTYSAQSATPTVPTNTSAITTDGRVKARRASLTGTAIGTETTLRSHDLTLPPAETIRDSVHPYHRV